MPRVYPFPPPSATQTARSKPARAHVEHATNIVAPSKANTNLIRAARIPQFMQECLENDGELIPKKQRQVAERIVYDYISLDPEENERIHGYLHYLTQYIERICAGEEVA